MYKEQTADFLRRHIRKFLQVAKDALQTGGYLSTAVFLYRPGCVCPTTLPDMQDQRDAFHNVAETAKKYGTTALITVGDTGNFIFGFAISKVDPPLAVIATYAQDTQGDISFDNDGVELVNDCPTRLIRLIGADALLDLFATQNIN